MVKKRPAITLFITLAVIVAMLSLVGIVFSYLSKAKVKAQDKSALIESNLIYADAVNTLKSFLGKKPSKGTLKQIYNIPLVISEKKGNFNLMVACTPSHAAIPVTWLRANVEKESEQKKFELANIVFESITTQARLRDPELLLTLISDALASNEQMFFGAKGRLKRDKKYFTYSSFKGVLTQYRLEADDNKVFDIDWQSYFSFGQDYDKIDGDFISAKLVALLFGFEVPFVEENFQSGDLKKFLLENGGDMELYNSGLFAKKVIVAMKCNISYSFSGKTYSFNFKYNNGKVDSFEFNK